MQRKCSCLDLLSPLDGVEIIFFLFYSHSFCSDQLVYVKYHINEYRKEPFLCVNGNDVLQNDSVYCSME